MCYATSRAVVYHYQNAYSITHALQYCRAFCLLDFYFLYVINMEKTWWSVTSEYMGWTCEQFLFTYDESERQEQIVNKNNAGLIFYADYYPRYNSLLNLDTTLEEDIILSFLYYWTKSWKYIYVKNEDLALLIKWSVSTVTRVIKSLVDKWYIDMKLKRVLWAWTDRKLRLDPTKINLINRINQNDFSDKSKWWAIKEYIKKNNKNISLGGVSETQTSWTREETNSTSTPSSTKEWTPPTPPQLLEAYENEKSLVQMIWNSKAVLERAEYKQSKKSRAYKTVSWFIQQLYGKVDTVRFWEVRWDTGTRFEYAVNKTKENEWKDIYRTEKEEREYQFYKKSLYLKKQENE